MTDDIRKAKIEAAERAAVEPILRALREDARMAVESIREKAIESACVEFTRGDMPSWRRWEEDERNETREAMARAIAAYERAMWRPIDEAPRNKMVLLAWRNWRTTEWENEVNHASTGKRHESGYSSISWHGEATHFRPLPAPPEDAA